MTLLLLEDAEPALGIVDAEDEEALFGAGARGEVGVFDVDFGLGETAGDAGEGAGFVVVLDRQHLAQDSEDPAFLEDGEGFFGVADDEADDGVIRGIGNRQGEDIDARAGEFIADVGQRAGFIGQEDGKLFDDFHSVIGVMVSPESVGTPRRGHNSQLRGNVKSAGLRGLFAGLGVEEEGDGAVVDEGDLHSGAETAGGDGPVEVRVEAGDHRLVEGDGAIGVGGAMPAGAGAFFGAGEEGELADQENPTAAVEDAAVHDAGVVVEEAEVDDLRSEPVDVVGGIGLLDAEKDEEAGGDGAGDFIFDGDGGGADSLEDGAHGGEIAGVGIAVTQGVFPCLTSRGAFFSEVKGKRG